MKRVEHLPENWTAKLKYDSSTITSAMLFSLLPINVANLTRLVGTAWSDTVANFVWLVTLVLLFPPIIVWLLKKRKTADRALHVYRNDVLLFKLQYRVRLARWSVQPTYNETDDDAKSSWIDFYVSSAPTRTFPRSVLLDMLEAHEEVNVLSSDLAVDYLRDRVLNRVQVEALVP